MYRRARAALQQQGRRRRRRRRQRRRHRSGACGVARQAADANTIPRYSLCIRSS